MVHNKRFVLITCMLLACGTGILFLQKRSAKKVPVMTAPVVHEFPELTFVRRIWENQQSRLDVDDPVIRGFSKKEVNENLNFALENLEIDIHNWLRTPWNIQNRFQRRCAPIEVSEQKIRFTCTTQSWYGEHANGPQTRTYTLSPAVGWVNEELQQETATDSVVEKRGDSQSIIHLHIETDQPLFVLDQSPAYTVRVTSHTPQANGRIDIFASDTDTIPLQTIPLDPNAWLADDVGRYFDAQDINFDGFLDIGIPVDGGAKWGSYQYWTFDSQTKRFFSTPLTNEFRNISFNEISFDKKKKQITAMAIDGSKKIYQYHNGHVKLIKEIDTNR